MLAYVLQLRSTQPIKAALCLDAALCNKLLGNKNCNILHRTQAICTHEMSADMSKMHKTFQSIKLLAITPWKLDSGAEAKHMLQSPVACWVMMWWHSWMITCDCDWQKCMSLDTDPPPPHTVLVCTEVSSWSAVPQCIVKWSATDNLYAPYSDHYDHCTARQLGVPTAASGCMCFKGLQVLKSCQHESYPATPLDSLVQLLYHGSEITSHRHVHALDQCTRYKHYAESWCKIAVKGFLI